MNKKEVITFRKAINPLEELLLIERVKDNGTVENVKLRFYSGQEMKLKVLPFVRHTGNKIEYLTSSPTGDYFIAGDDDNFILDVVVPVFYDDEIHVKVINESSEYIYNLVCDVTVDYYMGTDRIVAGGVINE